MDTNGNINRLFVSYEIALALKEKRYNEMCFGMYMREILKERCYCQNSEFQEEHQKVFIAAPLYQQVVDWFREKHNLEISTARIAVNTPKYSYVLVRTNEIDYNLYTSIPDCPLILHTPNEYPDYYTTLREGIKEALKLI